MRAVKPLVLAATLVIVGGTTAPELVQASPGQCYAARAEAAQRAVNLQVCWARYGNNSPVCQAALNALAIAVAKRKSACGG